MKKLAIIILATITISPVIAQNIDKQLKGIDQELEKVLETWNASGFAVAVVKKNEIVYAKGFGYRDYENKKPVTPNTLFAIGSCTKAFTTSLMGLLRKDGKLSFDDRPSKYIPGFMFYNEKMNNTITIKDLMCHRTGLPRHDYSWYLFPSHSKDSLIDRIEYQEPYTDVREQWYYNNFMFLTQGVIAEKITGESWEENVAKKLFAPLGMKRSNLNIEGLKNDENAALGYSLDKEDNIEKTDYYDIAAMSPAGSINSSVNEMSNWLMTWINAGKFNGEEILPTPFVHQAISGQMVVGSGLPDAENPDLHFGNYGYGWFLSSYKGHYRVEHGGNIDGFSANTCFFPSDSIGIVVLTNQSGSSIPAVVRNLIADRLLNVTRDDWNKDLSERRNERIKQQKEAEVDVVSTRITGTRLSHDLSDYAGTYSHPGYGSFQIMVENDSMFAQFALEKLWLKQYHYDVFQPFTITDNGIDSTESSALRFNFKTNDVGEIARLQVKFEAALPTLEFNREATKIDVDVEILEQYVGEYTLGGMTGKVYIKEDKLTLYVPGQPEYELYATDEHKFSIKILEGFNVEFVPGEDGAIQEVLFIQPNGTFKATKN